MTLGITREGFLRSTWRFMGSYRWGYKAIVLGFRVPFRVLQGLGINIGYNYSYPTYNPTYNCHEPPSRVGYPFVGCYKGFIQGFYEGLSGFVRVESVAFNRFGSYFDPYRVPRVFSSPTILDK